ncbi:MAG: metallophosphoesterase, partial [Ilumatobacteraceae bacterium]
MRILHTSDIHVGDPVERSGAIDALVDAARAHDVHVVVLVGDTFDHNRVPTEVGQALVDDLAAIGVPVVVLPGNHDCLVPGTIWGRVELPA